MYANKLITFGMYFRIQLFLSVFFSNHFVIPCLNFTGTQPWTHNCQRLTISIDSVISSQNDHTLLEEALIENTVVFTLVPHLRV